MAHSLLVLLGAGDTAAGDVLAVRVVDTLLGYRIAAAVVALVHVSKGGDNGESVEGAAGIYTPSHLRRAWAVPLKLMMGW